MAKFLRWALPAVVLGGLILSVGPSARAGEDAKTMWAQGVDLFDQGKFAEAQAKFDAVAKMVDDKTAKDLVERAGTRAMIRMLATRELGRGPSIIWELYNKYNRRQMIDEERIVKLVDQIVDDKLAVNQPAQYEKLLVELREIGQYAVPELCKHLEDTDKSKRALLRIALTRIGKRGTLAMVKLLGTGSDAAKETLALAIGDIVPADGRALPALKRLYDDPKTSETVRKNVGAAMAKISGLKPADMKSFTDYYYDLADRYYLEQAGVPDEAFEADGVLWKVDAAGKLSRRSVPSYAWNEEMAEDLVFECLAAAPEYERILPLLVSVQLAQREETTFMQDALKGFAPPYISDADKKVLGERGTLLVDTKLLAESVGPKILYRVVGKALKDERPLVGAAAIELLPLVDPRGDMLPGAQPVVVVPAKGDAKADDKKKPAKSDAKNPAPAAVVVAADGQSLIDALNSSDDGVAIAAAIAIARMDPPRAFPGSEKVVGKLADAISKSGPLQILVAEEDENVYKQIKLAAEQLGWGVNRATEGRNALAKASSFPPKDLVILSAGLKAEIKTEDVLAAMKKDQSLALLPVAILVPAADLAKEQARFGNLPMITREAQGEDFKAAALKALGDRGPSISKQQREAVAAKAAESLLLIDPRRTLMRPADAVAACRAALVNRPDEVRNPCVRALGLFGAKEVSVDLVKVFETKTNSATLRGNALWALARTDATAARKLFLACQKDEKDFAIRDLAAQGFGASMPEAKDVSEFQKSCRPERSAEGGLPGGAAAPAPAPAPAAPAKAEVK